MRGGAVGEGLTKLLGYAHTNVLCNIHEMSICASIYLTYPHWKGAFAPPNLLSTSRNIQE